MWWGDRWAFARDRDVTLGTLLDRLAVVGQHRRLVIEDGEAMTYGEAADLVARWAGHLSRRISPGDRVVVATPNSYRVLLMCLAVCRAGGVAVPVNMRMPAAEIDHVVADAGATLVLRSYDEVTAAPPTSCVPASPTDVAVLLYTSGTTGHPKGVAITHQALIRTARDLSVLPFPGRRRDVVTAMPVAHVAAFSMLIILAGLGSPVYLLSRFRAEEVLDAIERRRATMFVGVPTMYRMMLSAGAASRDLTSVRLWASGADTMPPALVRRFRAMGSALTVPRLGPVGPAGFVDGYGMVELAGGVAVRVWPPGWWGRGAGAFLALPRWRLAVIDDDGHTVARGGVGELVARGPGLMRGYHGPRSASAARPVTASGWMRTGDLARRGRLGFVELVGRKKDIVNHGGYTVVAAEVERVLELHDGVAEAAIIAVPDPLKGEVPLAVVRPDPEGPVPGEDELRAWVVERLVPYKAPTRVVIRLSLPRTGTGKVDKVQLRRMMVGNDMLR